MNLHIKNAHIWWADRNVIQIEQRDLYTANGRIVDQPAADALVVDLEGYTIFPGLINAHDHLELNHHPRSKFREVYDNAHQWGEDMNARLDTEPYKSLRAYPLQDKLFIGGLKNLLCGATTVAHHGPPHKPMFRKDFPVRVLKQYGWAHSLHFNTEQEVVESYRKTPKDWPWFIHLAEGTDEVAASEYQQLKALGCVGPNTVIVHGVGISNKDIEDAAAIVQGLVWCPSTNEYLLEQTIDPKLLGYWGLIYCLGGDSKLTANGDLLDELNLAYKLIQDPLWALDIAYGKAARLLKSREFGVLRMNCFADFIVIKTQHNIFDQFCISQRSDLHLVIKDGIPQIGDPAVMAKFPHIQTIAATLDGASKAIHIDLARRIHHCTLREPGLEVDALPTKRFWLI